MRSMQPFTLLLTGILIFAVSCNRHIAPQPGAETIFYPAPPDPARIQFLTSYGDSRDLCGTPSRFRTFVTGPQEAFPIKKPYGVLLDRGRLYVADPGSQAILIYDFEEKDFHSFTGQGRGSLRFPVNCNADRQGNIYVADVERRQVVIFNEEHEYLAEIGGGENFRPTDVFVRDERIWITDPKNNAVRVYDRLSRELLFTVPEQAHVGDEQWLYNPTNLWVQGDRLYVTDFGQSSIKVYSLDGEFLESIGSYGRGLGQFARPKGIAVDDEGKLFVVDASFQNVQIFDPGGRLLMFFGGTYQGPGDMYLPANVIVDRAHLQYYEHLVDPGYELQYLILVTNQYGPDKINVYGRVEPKDQL